GVALARTAGALRAARRYGSAALASNALHFGTDSAGSVAVLVGLVLARAGHPRADAVAALFVAVLVLLAAGRLMRRNVDVLMDRVPAEAQEVATDAIARLRPAVELRRLRMRQAAGRHFADVVIGVPPGAAARERGRRGAGELRLGRGRDGGADPSRAARRARARAGSADHRHRRRRGGCPEDRPGDNRVAAAQASVPADRGGAHRVPDA